MENGLIVHNSMVNASSVLNGTLLPKEFIFRLISLGKVAKIEVASLGTEVASLGTEVALLDTGVALLGAEVALLDIEVAPLAAYISFNSTDGV